MWYMRILINQWSLIGGWCFAFNQVCVCVLWLQLILSCQNCARKSVESKKSHGDHKAMEHGLENRLAILPISCNILKDRISKNMKRTQRRMKSMVQFLFLRVPSSPISKAYRAQRSQSHTNVKNQILSNSTQYALQLHEPHVTWTILWYFAYLANFPWFYNSMSEQQNVRNIHQHGFPSRRHHYFPSQPVAFRQESYQWKDLKQLGSMCMWFNESTQKLKWHVWKISEITSKRIVFVVFWGRSTTVSCL